MFMAILGAHQRPKSHDRADDETTKRRIRESVIPKIANGLFFVFRNNLIVVFLATIVLTDKRLPVLKKAAHVVELLGVTESE